MVVQFIFFVVEAESNSSSSLVRALGPVCLKLVTRTHPDSVFDDPHMDGKLIG